MCFVLYRIVNPRKSPQEQTRSGRKIWNITKISGQLKKNHYKDLNERYTGSQLLEHLKDTLEIIDIEQDEKEITNLHFL